jgi:hypothetical protein
MLPPIVGGKVGGGGDAERRLASLEAGLEAAGRWNVPSNRWRRRWRRWGSRATPGFVGSRSEGGGQAQQRLQSLEATVEVLGRSSDTSLRWKQG